METESTIEGFGGFNDLYSYRERKKKGNLENYFTELIKFMCSVSNEFKERFINEFLLRDNPLIDTTKVIITTQESHPSSAKNKNRDMPDLFIYMNSTEYENNNPHIICEHKIDQKTDDKQLECYHKTFPKVPIKFITPKRPVYKSKKDNIEHLYWEDLFEILKEFFNGSFYKTELVGKDTEPALIHKFLEFMDEIGINALNEEYFIKRYSDFPKFCKEIIRSLQSYLEISSQLKATYSLGRPSRLKRFIKNDNIYGKKEGEKDLYYGIYIDDFNKVIVYGWDDKKSNGTNQKNINYNFKIKEKEVIKANKVLYDIYALFYHILIDISNELKKVNINEDSIGIRYENNGDLYVDYKITKEKDDWKDHCFGLIIEEDKIIIDYNEEGENYENKKIELMNFKFDKLYNKLREFIKSDFGEVKEN